MTIEKFEKARAIRDRIEDLQQNIADLHSHRISHVHLFNGVQLREVDRMRIKEVLIKSYQEKIDSLEERFKEI